MALTHNGTAARIPGAIHKSEATDSLRLVTKRLIWRSSMHNTATVQRQEILALHRECIRMFAQLIGESPYAVNTACKQNMRFALKTGYTLLATNNFNLARTTDRIRNGIRDIGANSAVIAELTTAAALAETLQFVEVSEIPERTDRKTADFIAKWRDGQLIEIEATRKARHKAANLAQANAHRVLYNLLHARKEQLEIPMSAYIASLDDATIDDLTTAAGLLRSSRPTIEDPMRYWISVGGAQFSPPAWWRPEWPLNQLRLRERHILFGYQSPIDGYMRAIARKAEGHQESGFHPFIIAHDCCGIANGVYALRSRVANELSKRTWVHVDGVLLFRLAMSSAGAIGWIWDLVPNPNLNRLPSELVQLRPPENHWIPPTATFHPQLDDSQFVTYADPIQ